MSARCRVCRSSFVTRDRLIEHLATHSSSVLAEELVKAVEHAADMQRLAMMAERCGKVGYTTEQAAVNALLSIWQARGDDPIRREIRTYQCHRCAGRWHLTSQQPIYRGEAS